MKRLDERGDAADPARLGGGSTGEVWQPGGGGRGACAIASLVPRITQKSFEKHGFAAASLIMDWAQIVGRDRARDTRPVKLKWPRAAEKSSDTAARGEGRPAATLVLQVDPAVALDIQYQSAQIIERINAYFGYRAVASLRLVQETIGQEGTAHDTLRGLDRGAAALPSTAAKPSNDTKMGGSDVNSDPLSAALARLGAQVAAQSRRRNKVD